MAIVYDERHYAILDSTTELILGTRTHGFRYDDGESAPSDPADPTGQELVKVTAGELGSDTIQEFSYKKKAVFVSGSFSSWSARDASPTVVTSANPKADGSNTPTITISSGTANSDYVVSCNRRIDCELTGDAGTLDGSGGDTFKVRTYGLGNFELTVSPDGHDDFQTKTITVTVDIGSFA